MAELSLRIILSIVMGKFLAEIFTSVVYLTILVMVSLTANLGGGPS